MMALRRRLVVLVPPLAVCALLASASAQAQASDSIWGTGQHHGARWPPDATVSDRLSGAVDGFGPVADPMTGSMGASSPSAASSHASMAMAAPSAAVGSSSATTPTAVDAWSPVSRFRTADGWFASPIHATLLPDGRIQFIGIARDTDPPTPTSQARRVSWVYAPPAIGTDAAADVVIDEQQEPVERDGTVVDDVVVYDDLYCTSVALDDTGRLVTAGGTRVIIDRATGAVRYTLGLPYQTIQDANTWQRLPGEMVGTGYLNSPARWYPTLTRLPDQRMLVSGGLELITTTGTGTDNRSVETLNPHTGQRVLISTDQQTPTQIHARDYTAVFVLPTASSPKDLLMIADAGTPVTTAATAGAGWNVLATRPDHGATTQPDWGSSSVMLPIRVDNSAYRNGSIMVTSGDMVGTYQRTADVFDPMSGTWGPSVDVGINRHHPDAVVLADGRVLLVAGHDMSGSTEVTRAQYVDPLSGFSVTTGTSSSGVIRGYHSVALLLPDGRVLVGGGRGVVTADTLEKPTFQIYTPDYLARPRPMIASAPSELAYDSLFQLPTVGTPSEVMLVALGSQTHSFDTGQRVVQLPIGRTWNRQDGASLSIVGTPHDSHVAPPGYYGLVVIDQARTPSVATVVHVG